MNHSIIEVIFQVVGRVRPGEEVRVSGNVPALGKDSPQRAIPLVTTPSDYPMWRTKEAIFLPGDAGAVRYRYCIFSGGKFSRWEEPTGGETRILEASKTDRYMKITEDVLGEVSAANQMLLRSQSRSPTARKLPIVSASEGRSQQARRFAEWSRKSLADEQVKSQDGVVIVSYFLPVILKRTSSGHWTAEWDKENLLSLQLNMRLIWVGSIRYANAPIPVEEEDSVARVLAEMNCYPIFINQNMHFQFYDIFCKQTLWMALHHIADVYGPVKKNDLGAKGEQSLWFTFSTVHKLFRDKVLEVYQESYLIWIHGFHLMLLPSYLRRRLPVAKIGYFNHTPFPSSEIWRTMARREDLIRGLLGADQIGFHLYEYARHFLTTCRRLLGCSCEVNAAGMMTVMLDGREVVITCIHVGVDLPRVDDILLKASFVNDVEMWRSRFPNKIIVSGIDRLERLKGIPLKLKAIEHFMDENPMWRGKIVFVLIGVTAAERGFDYSLTLQDVSATVKRINKKHAAALAAAAGAGAGASAASGPSTAATTPRTPQGWSQDLDMSVLIYFEERHDREIRLAQRLALFAATDILMITSTRDGLNRMPMEFTLARRRNGELVQAGIVNAGEAETPVQFGASLPSRGHVIISEFISSARVVRGALIVNPWRVEEVTGAIHHALNMREAERADRWRRNLEFSTRLTTSNWAIHVLHDLKAVEKSSDPNANYAVGFGLHHKVINLKQGFQPLNTKEVLKAYRTARHRLILLDWGGTLMTDQNKADKLQAYAIATGVAFRDGPSQELKTILELICRDLRNIVFVVSGKELQSVANVFGGFRGLGLGAEHGFYYRWPRDDVVPAGHAVVDMDTNEAHSDRSLNISNSKAGVSGTQRTTTTKANKWQTTSELGDQTWKEAAKLIMDIFVQRTQGTYIEQKNNALIWQFRDADPEFGMMQSKELEEHLADITKPYDVSVIRGGGDSDGYIEVRPTAVSKGLFLDHAYNTMKGMGKEPDFVMVIGDDSSDEPMFEELARIQELVQTHQQQHPTHQHHQHHHHNIHAGVPPRHQGGHGHGHESTGLSAFSVTVGKKPTSASAYVDDPAAVMELLTTLSRSVEREKRHFSAVDLPSQAHSDVSAFARAATAQQEQDQQMRKQAVQFPQGSLSGKSTLVASFGSPGGGGGGGAGFSKALSTGRLALESDDSQSSRRKSLTKERQQESGGAGGGIGGMARVESNSHLSIQEYMNSIQSGNQEDDGAIFF